MMCRLRSRVGLYCSFGLLVLSCWIALEGMAQGQAVPVHDVGAELFSWVLGSGAVLFGALWTLVQYHLRKSEALQGKAIAEAITDAMTRHNADTYAHPQASEHNHEPIFVALERMERKLDRLIAEHEMMNGLCPANGGKK